MQEQQQKGRAVAAACNEIDVKQRLRNYLSFSGKDILFIIDSIPEFLLSKAKPLRRIRPLIFV